MYVIGKFSRMCGVPSGTLRYWERCGLIKPSHIDCASGYRYYKTSQLRQVYMVRALQSIGMPNREITQYLNQPLSTQLLEKQKLLIEHRIKVQENHLNNIKYYEESLNHIYEVMLKSLPGFYALFCSGVFADVPSIIARFNQMRRLVVETEPRPENSPVSIGQYFNEEFNKQNQINSSLYVEISNPELYDGNTICYVPPESLSVTVTHRGYYRFLGDAYIQAYQFIEENGLKVIGSPREWYVVDSWQTNTKEADYVTELQIPVSYS